MCTQRRYQIRGEEAVRSHSVDPSALGTNLDEEREDEH